MTTEVIENKSFQERMFDRIRDQMGDLMTQDELKKIVETAVDKAFFESSVIKHGYGREEIKPPIFVAMIEKELKDQVAMLAKGWLTENSDKVNQIINDAIAKGMFGIMTSYIDGLARQPLYNFANELRSKGLQI